jgi:hypothetical protein
MRIINCRQQSEEWDRWRNRPTASEFGKFVTPARGEYSSQATGYAAKIVAKRLGVYTEPPPSFWMEWGIEHEPNARNAYTLETGREVREVGFILPDGTDAYGGSPDGLISGARGYEGGLEVKCPMPETLIRWHADGVLPMEYKPQVQGLLLISGLKWWDFYGFHPELEPFLLRIRPDIKYQTKMAECLLLLLEQVRRIESHVKKMRHKLVSQHGIVRIENE